jgi:YD repeat-containing protein
MGRAEAETPLPAPARAVAYTDAEGRPTDDPAAAVRGEMVEYDAHGRLRRRTRFFLTERELPWLPVGEAAFLLWVLVALMLVWLGIGLVLIA